VVREGCTVGRGARTWRSVIGPGRDIGQGKGISFAWVGEHCAPERLEVASEPRFASVVLPSRRSLHRCNHRLFPVVKRAMDICGALVGLVLTLPLYPFIAIAIKVTSPGSVFYVHRRQTVRGKEFGCLKFRSMLDHAHELQKELPNEVDGPQFHMENDPRLTRVGRFLRRTNLDEVPQFWNVLLGQMSLVGPRPSPDEENRYCPAWREARLSVRPGLTGMWQIRRSCDRSVGDFHEWIEYDIRYLRECSLRTDLSLLCRTLWQMAKRFCRVVDGVVPFASSRAARRDRPRRAVRMRCEKTAADALINRRQYDNR
jgi:lipopolysaccharide/colanic/teichoic acid biosynthesis glycosyltransferase